MHQPDQENPPQTQADSAFETIGLNRQERHSSTALTDTRVLAEMSNSKADPHAQRPAPRFDYRLIEMIGQGGMGEVWKAVQHTLRRIVAVKRLRAPESEDVRYLFEEQFCHEAVITAQLDHPNIIPAYDLGTDDEGWPLLAMKLVEGTEWSSLIARDYETLSLTDYLARHLAILISVTQATAFAHSRGIVHRDLKPQQVIVGDYGEVYLTDWGLAVLYDRDLIMQARGGLPPPDLPSIDSAPNPAGTPAYMAPEQSHESARNIGPWTDVYLLGATLYHILTNNSPRLGGGFGVLSRQIETGFYIPFEQWSDSHPIPEELAHLVTEAMSVDIHRRPSAKAFISRLQSYLSGAGARGESEALVEQVEEGLSKDVKGDYTNYSALLASTSRAAHLWPANPKVDALKDRILTDFVELALAHGDLSLARVQADRLSSETNRESLLAVVEQGEARHAARERTRHVLLAVSILLVAIVLGGTLFFNRQLTYRTAMAETATEQAKKAETQALANRELLSEQLYRNNLALVEQLLSEGQPIEARRRLLSTPSELRHIEWGLLYAESLLEGSRIPLNAGPLADIAAPPDGDYFLASSQNGKVIHVAYEQDPPKITELPVPVHVSKLDISQDGKVWACGGGDGSVFLLSENGQKVSLLSKIEKRVTDLAFSPAGDRLLVLDSSGEINILAVPEGTNIWTSNVDPADDWVEIGEIDAAAWDPAGGQIAVADHEFRIRLLSAEDGSIERLLEGHVAAVRSIAFLPDGEHLISGGKDGQVFLWDISSGEELLNPLRRLQINSEIDERAFITEVLASNRGDNVITVSANRRCALRDTATGGVLWEMIGHEGPIVGASLIEDGNLLLTASQDGSAAFWQMSPKEVTRHLNGHDGRVVTHGFTPHGEQLITFGHDNTVRLWDTQSSEEVLNIQPAMGRYPYAEGRLSMDGRRIITITKANQAELFDAETGALLARGPDNDVDMDDAALAPDNQLFAAGGLNGFLYIARFDDENNDPRILDAPHANVTCVEFSPDGKLLAVGFRDRSIWVYEVPTGSLRYKLDAGNSWAETVTFSPDAKKLLAAGFDSLVRQWHMADGSLIHALPGHQGWVAEARYTPDGKRILSVSPVDSTLRIWKADTGEPLIAYKGIGETIQSVSVSPDMQRLAVAFQNQPPRILDIAPWSGGEKKLRAWEFARFQELLKTTIDYPIGVRYSDLMGLASVLEEHFGEASGGPLTPVLPGQLRSLGGRELRILVEGPPPDPTGNRRMSIAGDRPELAAWMPGIVPLKPIGFIEEGKGQWEYRIGFRPMEFKLTFGERAEDWDTSQEWPGSPNRYIKKDTLLFLDQLGGVVYFARFGQTEEKFRQEFESQAE